MKKRTRAALKRAFDHCAWKYRGRKALIRACRDGADAGVDEVRHEAPSLGFHVSGDSVCLNRNDVDFIVRQGTADCSRVAASARGAKEKIRAEGCFNGVDKVEFHLRGMDKLLRK